MAHHGLLKPNWDYLRVDKNIASDFFAIFSRIEYALKSTGFAKAGQHGGAMPNWTGFLEQPKLELNAENIENYHKAVSFLVENPPRVQLVNPQTKCAFYPNEAAPMHGQTDGIKAINAARQVRNNLFHGGKFMNGADAERNGELIKASHIVLTALVLGNPQLQQNYDY